MPIATLEELAALAGGRIVGDPDTSIIGVAPIDRAAAGAITFLANPKYAPFLADTAASAVILAEPALADKPSALPALVHDSPDYAFALIAEHFLDDRPAPTPGVHPTAVVGDDVTIGADASIGPLCVIEDGATIGDRSVIGAQCFLGRLSRVGADCRLHPQVFLGDKCELGDRVILHPGVVIGGDGFGYAEFPETIAEVEWPITTWKKVPQLGNVVLEDDVEVGANSTIDRARIDSTRIGAGTKIDDLCIIAHNVQIGKHNAIAAQTGIAGSTRLGHGVICGGQVGIVGHAEIADGQILLAKAGVQSLPRAAPGTYWQGQPAVPNRGFAKQTALIHRLPKLVQRVKDLEARLAALEAAPDSTPEPA